MLRRSHEAMEATQVPRESIQQVFEQLAVHTAADGGGDSTAADRRRNSSFLYPQGAPQTTGIERQSQQQQLNMRGFENIETLAGGEDEWQIWSWKLKTAVSGMSGGLAELLNAAETGGVRNAEEILQDDEFVDANREKCIEASEEVYSASAECTNSEASTIARSVTGLDGVEAWARLHAKLQQKNIGKQIQSAT